MHNAVSIREVKDGVLLQIFVKPNQPKFRIEVDGGEVVVYATEEPEKGKVNKQIIKEAGHIFGFTAEIASGSTSRQKILLLRGATKTQVETALSTLLRKN